jgi:hypothetical protein
MRFSAPMLLAGMLAVSPALADGNDEALPRITVKPSLCITDKRTPTCDLTFVIEWAAQSVALHCVRMAEEDDVLECWQDADNGATTAQREIARTTPVNLERDGEAQPIAETAVEVLQKDSSDRRRRRRTRYVWDVL